MSYASFAAPLIVPSVRLPRLRAGWLASAGRVGAMVVQSVLLAAILWVLVAAPGFLSGRTGLRTSGEVLAARSISH